MKSKRTNAGVFRVLVALAAVGIGIWLRGRARRRLSSRAYDRRAATFADTDPRGAGSNSNDIVQEASEQSFPASDPPAWTYRPGPAG